MRYEETRRALIIAVETYEQMQSVLDGTTEAACEFAKWLIAYKSIKPQHIYVCATGKGFPKGTRAFAATREGIKEAIAELATGRDSTEELYVFFSGHGLLVRLNGDDPGVDTLLPADFKSVSMSMDKPIQLEELQQKLKMWIGGEAHLYFIDACRNEAEGERTGLGMKLERARKGRRERYALYSTVPGGAASVNSGFAAALVSALKGDPGAAVEVDGRLRITLHSLRSYLEAKL